MSEELSNGDICRVCRSEGGADRPLFHPCICTGSIKWIHQECLVQWMRFLPLYFSFTGYDREKFFQIFSQGILWIMWSQIFIHPNLFTGYAQATSGQRFSVRFIVFSGNCSEILVALHFGCFGLVGGGSTDCLSNISRAFCRFVLLPLQNVSF